MDSLLQPQSDSGPLIELKTVSLDRVERAVLLVVASKDKDNLVEGHHARSVTLVGH